MCAIRERTNSFATLCNANKELSHTANRTAKWKNIAIIELYNSIIELSNSFKDIKLN